MNNQIERIHAENLKLISDNNITVGSQWILVNAHLKNPNLRLPAIAEVTSIHELYGWLLFNNEDTNIPQRVAEFLTLYEPLANKVK